MFKVKVFLFLTLIKNSFSPCATDKRKNDFERPATTYSIQKIARLPAVLSESSGVVMLSDTTFLSLNDGGKPELYEVTLDGRLRSSIFIPNSSNQDWEDITTDEKGFVYIGDFGNNSNRRQNLRIFRYDPKRKLTDTISFSYSDQLEFPPEKANRNFDCEAIFHHHDSLFIVSKNRGTKEVRFYKFSDQPGSYQISPFYTTFLSSMITGASIDSKHERVALLSYGKIYFFDLLSGTETLLKPCSCLGFARNGQAEGISYLENNSLLITNEQGNVFLVRPKNK